MPDGLNGVRFGVTNKANRPALNPTGAVDAGDVRSGLVVHPALFVSNHTLNIVKWNAIKFAAEIADRSIHSLNLKLANLACCPNASGAIKLRALKPDTRNLAIGAKNFPRGREEVEVKSSLLRF